MRWTGAPQALARWVGERERFADDFTRADSTNLGPAWEERTGDAKIQSNHIASNTNPALALWVGTLPADYECAVVLVDGTPLGSGPVVRVQAGATPDLYLLNLSNAGDLRLWRRIATVFTQLGPTVNIGAPAAGKRLALEVRGAQLRAYYADTLRINQSDATIAAPGRAGLWFGAIGVVLDTMRVAALAGWEIGHRFGAALEAAG